MEGLGERLPQLSRDRQRADVDQSFPKLFSSDLETSSTPVFLHRILSRPSNGKG